MIPRGVLLVVLERLGLTPNQIQEIMAELDRELADDPAEPDSGGAA